MAIGVNPSWSTSSTNLLQHLDTPAGTALFTLTAELTARHSDRKGLSCYEMRNLLSIQSVRQIWDQTGLLDSPGRKTAGETVISFAPEPLPQKVQLDHGTNCLMAFYLRM